MPHKIVNSNSTSTTAYDGPAARTRSKKPPNTSNPTPSPAKHQPAAPTQPTRPSSRATGKTRSGAATTTRATQATESSRSKRKETSGRAKRAVPRTKAALTSLSPHVKAGLRDLGKANPSGTNKAPPIPNRRLPQRSSKIVKADDMKHPAGNGDQSRPVITMQPSSGHQIITPALPSGRNRTFAPVAATATMDEAPSEEVTPPPQPANGAVDNPTLTPRDENTEASAAPKLQGPMFTGRNAILDALNSATQENYAETRSSRVRQATRRANPMETEAKKATAALPLPSRGMTGPQALPVPLLPHHEPHVATALLIPAPPLPYRPKTRALPVPPLPYRPQIAQAANGIPPSPYRKALIIPTAPPLPSRKAQGGPAPIRRFGEIPSTQQAPRVIRSEFKSRKTITFEIKVEEEEDPTLLRAPQEDGSESDKEGHVSDESSEEDIYGGGVAAWSREVHEAKSKNPGKRNYHEDDEGSESETTDSEDEAQNARFERPMKKMKVRNGECADEDAPAKYAPQVESNVKTGNETISDWSL